MNRTTQNGTAMGRQSDSTPLINCDGCPATDVPLVTEVEVPREYSSDMLRLCQSCASYLDELSAIGAEARQRTLSHWVKKSRERRIARLGENRR